jgi:hypothetical protein
MTHQNAVDRPSPGTKYSRWIVWLGVAIVVVCAVYTAGWFYLATKLEDGTRVALEASRAQGNDAECVNPTARGYPFRMGLFCDSVSFSEAGSNVKLTAGAFRSAGQIYDPARLVAELDGPATVTAPGAGTLALSWSQLRASARLAQPLPERISVEGAALKVAREDGKPLVSADSFEGHMRPNGADLDLAGRFGALALDPAVVDGRVLPALSGEADVSVANGVSMVESGDHALRGKSGTIRTLALSLGGDGRISVSGPFSIDQAGLIDADLMVSIVQPQALAATLSDAFPEARDKIQQSFAGLALLGDKPTLPLKITGGNAMLAFIPLGRIPPVQE